MKYNMLSEKGPEGDNKLTITKRARSKADPATGKRAPEYNEEIQEDIEHAPPSDRGKAGRIVDRFLLLLNEQMD